MAAAEPAEPAVVPVVVEFTTDDVELLTAALELVADIQEHLAHRAVHETAPMLAEVATAIARVLDGTGPGDADVDPWGHDCQPVPAGMLDLLRAHAVHDAERRHPR